MKSALILFAHGAREAEWVKPFLAIRNKVASACPDVTVELAFLETMTPPLDECISGLAASGHSRITVAPLFLGMGGHLKRDLPRLLDSIRDRHRDLDIVVVSPIGEVGEVLDAIAGWLIGGTLR